MFSNQSQRTCPIMCLIICESHAKDKMFKSKYATLVHFHNSQQILISLAHWQF